MPEYTGKKVHGKWRQNKDIFMEENLKEIVARRCTIQ